MNRKEILVKTLRHEAVDQVPGFPLPVCMQAY